MHMRYVTMIHLVRIHPYGMTLARLKVVLLGDTNTGKTSLFESFTQHRYSGPTSPTIGADFVTKTLVSSKGKTFTLMLWDTAGHERFSSMARIFYRGAGAAIVCYDLVNKNSWQRAKFWVYELKKNEEECKIYLCGMKLDLIEEGHMERAVEDAESYAAEIQAKYFETSSKTGKNIDELFQTITDDYENDPAWAVTESICLHGDVVKSNCC